MLENYFVDSCSKITTLRNDFGDEVQDDVQVLLCRWRDITQVRRGSHQDVSDSDALVHFPTDAGVERGDVLKFGNDFYQVDQIVYAKRLGETVVQFIKCQCTITSLVVS